MKQNYKIEHVLEDPKQATIHLALPLQLKQDWGYPKKKSLQLKRLQSYNSSNFLLYLYVEENATKNFEVLQL